MGALAIDDRKYARVLALLPRLVAGYLKRIAK